MKTNGQEYQTWSLIESVASRYPEHHDALLQLVAALFQLPDVVNLNGQVEIQWSEQGEPIARAWADFTEQRNSESYYDLNTNSIAFQAKMSATGIPGLDHTSDSVGDFRYAFELTPRDEASLKHGDIQTLNVNIPIVAQWIFYAGNVIFSKDEKSPRYSEGLWKGDGGFNQPRWEFWKSRAAWVSGLKAVHPKTRELAEKIVEAMDKVEEGYYA